MHGKIFQLGLKPFTEDEMLTPDYFYDNSADFAYSIGDKITGDNRLSCIKGLSRTFSECLDYDNGTLVYKGIGTFTKDWAAEIKQLAEGLTPEDMMSNLKLYQLAKLTEETHKRSISRFFINDWNEYAAPASDLIQFLLQLEPGTRLYVGSVIEYYD